MDRPQAHILVVEDETLQRTLLLDALRVAGYSVMGAGSSEEAMGLLAQQFFEVAVVDVFLPGRTGLDFLRAIRSVSPWTEVIVITARPTVRVAIDSIRGGAFDFMVKPIDAARITESVTRAVEHGRARKRARIHEAGFRLIAGDRASLPTKAVEIVRDVLEADETSLMLPRPDGRLWIAASTALDPEIRASVRVGMGERVVGRVAEDREPLLLLGSLRRDPRFNAVEANERLVSSIVYPLLFEGGLEGVLTVGRRIGSRPFRAVDMAWAEQMAHALALSLHHSSLARELRELDHA